MSKTKTGSISRRHLGRLALASAATSSLLPASVSAQATYPSQDVHFLCGFAAGSGADIIVRFFAEKMKPIFKRNVIVENKPGALGNFATEMLSRAKPDGHTIQVAGASSLAANMHIFKNPPVNVAETVRVAATISTASMFLVVRPDAPWKDAAELTAFVKAKGDKATYGYVTPIAKTIGAMYQDMSGHKALDVPYKTGADFMGDLASGTLDFAIADQIQAMSQMRAGKMKLLAVGSKNRMQAAPDIPAFSEFGYPIDVQTWWGAMVPAGTPEPIVRQLNTWFSQVVASEEAKVFLNNLASDPWVSTPEQAQAYFLQQIKDWGNYVRLAKIEQL
jgi:tripartite-type tricarboxylate transporter receptor subunit TctC